MRMDTLWEEPVSHGLKVERNLNFSTIVNEEDEYGFNRKKTTRDPMSHRIIEKRRRDRMNNCLADLSRLVPTNYLKKGRGRIEKTEIIEMAIKHLKHLQAHPCKDMSTCEVAKVTEQDHKRQYRLGFHECMSETVRFLVEIEGLYAGDGLCVRLVNHLQKHYDKVAGGMCYTQALGMMSSEEPKILPMDTESNHAQPPSLEIYAEATSTADSMQTNHSTETRSVDVFPNGDILKHEVEVNSDCTVTSIHEHSDYIPNYGPAAPTTPTPVKVTSQLREMLQNPGLPKDHFRNHTSAIVSPEMSSYSVTTNGPQNMSPKSEEVYKFKNNIKHRFNADLRQHTASPTDSHSDHQSIPDEERTSNESRLNSASIADDRLIVPVVQNGHANGHHGHTNGHHHPPFSEFSPAAHTELTVKIPDRNGDDMHVHWDSHVETGSSCGSNPSTPPVARSNGSSSGYSTSGEMPPATNSKFKAPGQQSPVASPYSRTPDHVLNRSPSPPATPQQTSGVPIFALHPKGTFYIPLTIDAAFLAPYLLGVDDMAPVLHPVSICVNFSLCQTVKVEKLNSTACHFRTQSYFTDRYSAYGERPHL